MQEGHSTSEVASLLDVTPAQLRTLVRAAFPASGRDEDGGARFSFQEVALLRTAKGLLDAQVPAVRLRKALQRLRAQLPEGKPLSAVSISVDGNRVVVRDGGTRWQPDSGQVLMDFGLDELESPPATAAAGAAPARAPADEGLSASEWYELGCDLEELEPQRALGAYRKALELQPGHADAHVNLGRLLQERGDLTGAEEHYRAALAARPEDAVAAYNLGTVLEDQKRWKDAIAAYLVAIARPPGSADAHFNLARLYEAAGDKVAALRHLKTARQLSGRG
jgi:tetratricopeptide (TPR) repeat protein